MNYTSYVDDHLPCDTQRRSSGLPFRQRQLGRGCCYTTGKPPFNYFSIVKSSTSGLVIYEKNTTPGELNIGVANNTFEKNTKGLRFVIASDYDITSPVSSNTFYDNDYGLHTYTTQDPTYPLHCGLNRLTLTQNNFSKVYSNINLFTGFHQSNLMTTLLLLG